jgi:hypothetical protein
MAKFFAAVVFGECIAADAGHRAWDVNARQGGAGAKDMCSMIWNGYVRE